MGLNIKGYKWTCGVTFRSEKGQTVVIVQSHGACLTCTVCLHKVLLHPAFHSVLLLSGRSSHCPQRSTQTCRVSTSLADVRSLRLTFTCLCNTVTQRDAAPSSGFSHSCHNFMFSERDTQKTGVRRGRTLCLQANCKGTQSHRGGGSRA